MAKLKHADLTAMIERLAYFKAESRGFAPGRELTDWLDAEAELAATATPSKSSRGKRKVMAKKNATRSKRSATATASS